jgi:hypothetical protein
LTMAYLIAAKIANPSLPAGWTSLMTTVLLIGGLQMIGLGLLGEYLGRVYLKLNHKPQYVVRETTFSEPSSWEPQVFRADYGP